MREKMICGKFPRVLPGQQTLLVLEMHFVEDFWLGGVKTMIHVMQAHVLQ